MKSRLIVLLFSTAVVGAVGSFVGVASACGNGVEHRRDPVVEKLYTAESSLRSGELARAAHLATQLGPDLRKQKYVRGLRPLRVARVMALVIVRSGGAWLEDGRLVVPEEKGRAENLDWAVMQLRLRSENAPKNTSYRVDLGEAMAAVERHKKEALALLDGLAKNDLVHSPEALAALAALRDEVGDADGATKARAACEKRARNKNVCRPKERSRSRSEDSRKAA